MKKQKQCKLCKKYYNKYPLQKDDEGKLVHKIKNHYYMSPIQCYFSNTKTEWNCQTIGLIRDLVYEGQELKPGIQYTYCDDQKYATIKIDNIREDDKWIGRALWVSWYKQRGSTDALWILDNISKPRKPTEEELLAISKYYNKENKC